MKKKMIIPVMLVSFLISTCVNPCLAETVDAINRAEEVATLAPVAAPMPPAPSVPAPAATSMPPAPPSATPPASAPDMASMPPVPPSVMPPAASSQASAQSEQIKIDYNKPLVPESQYFCYRCLNSANVTLKSLQVMDCDRLRCIYHEDPQRAVDHVSLLILVQRALQGVDIRNMPQQDRIDLSYATILGELRKYGRHNDARGYMGLIDGDCHDKLVIPSIAALCQVFEGVKGAIILELYHYKSFFPKV